MHRIFQIPELLLAVLEHLEERCDQLHFGFTCKDIWTVPVGGIWRDIPDESALVTISPDVRASFQDTHSYSCHAPLNAADAKLMLKYGYHIGSWSFSDFRRLPSAAALRHTLFVTMMYAGDVPLFPNLRCLDMKVEDPVVFSATARLVFMSPSVTELQIILSPTFFTSSNDVHIFISGMETISHKLRLLSLKCKGDHDEDRTLEVVQGLSFLLPTLTNVVYLTTNITSPGNSFLHLLSYLPLLEELQIDLDPEPHNPEVLAFPEGAFPSLQALNVDQGIEPPFPLDYDRLLHAISSTNFQAFGFVLVHSTYFDTILQTIATKWSSTFARLVLILHGIDDPGQEVAFGAFAPLIACHCLEALHIFTSCRVDFTDDELELMLEAWPMLGSLSIFSGEEVGWIPRTTSYVLRRIGAKLPALQWLRFSINFDAAYAPSGAAELSSSSTRLEHSHAVASTCSNPLEVVTLLHAIFPGLLSFQSSDQEQMKEVTRLMALPDESEFFSDDDDE